MKLREKTISILLLALLLPLTLEIFYVRHMATDYYTQQQGTLYLTIATELSESFSLGIARQMNLLQNWIGSLSAGEMIAEMPLPDNDSVENEILDARWNTLSATDEPLKSILENPVSQTLKRIRQIRPFYAEILLTDRYGRLIAATNPSSDYLQSDEAWWQQSAQLPILNEGFISEINYDASAGLQAIDLCFPVYDAQQNFRGVMKCALNAEQLLKRLAPPPWNREILREVILPDGRVFSRINQSGDTGLPEVISQETLRLLISNLKTYQTAELTPGSRSLVSIAPLTFNADRKPAAYIIVHRDYDKALLPVHNAIARLTRNNLIGLILFAAGASLLATRWIIRPVRLLQSAARSLENHARTEEKGEPEAIRESLRNTRHHIAKLKLIKSNDEMQELAVDFGDMSHRILKFHRQIEVEVAERTEQINEDLLLAREFQEALLPDKHPDIPLAADHDPYKLNFNHIYKPALSVSGDFFDIAKISNHCVRILIADVMGHGARSALMTAILHALVHNPENHIQNPAVLLDMMNREFFSLGERAKNTFFVTAVHLIIDTRKRIIRYASAGHPAPLIVDRTTGMIQPLPAENDRSPAAGLIEDVEYRTHEIPINHEETLLLYTDGVLEALNSKEEEFGSERLKESLQSAFRAGKLEDLPKHVLESVEIFCGNTPAMDDICLISVDITKTQQQQNCPLQPRSVC